MDITVYTQSGCVYCDRIKEFLHKNKISFTEKNISQKNDYYHELLESGAQGVPFTLVKNEKYSGFNEEVKKVLINFAK